MLYSNNELAARVKAWIKQIRREKPNSYPCNIPFSLEMCDAAHQELTFRFDVRTDMENPWGVTHGGVLAIAMDWAMGVTARVVLNLADTPTVNMNIDYLRPVPLNASVLIHVRILHSGNHLATLHAVAYLDGDERPYVSAEGVYFMKNMPLVLREL